MLSIEVQSVRLMFEHSLVSLSKWEAVHQKPFFAWSEKDAKTHEEMLSYFEQMLVSPEDRTDLIAQLTPEDHMALVTYINENRTATVVNEVQNKPGRKENVTSELIYFWMISFNIPFEADKWHLSRLITLVKVCGVKNSKPQKQDPGAAAARFRELNEQRKKQMGTAG